MVASAFLLAAAASIGLVAWTVLFPSYDGYDVHLLEDDLEAFDLPSRAELIDVRLHPCTGEGSVPASASRSHVVVDTIDAEAVAPGWIVVSETCGPDLRASGRGAAPRGRVARRHAGRGPALTTSGGSSC